MKNKKILAILVMVSITMGGLSYSYADYKDSNNLNKTFKEFHDFRLDKPVLTTIEKNDLEKMNSEERREFLKEKKDILIKKNEAKEEVIDALLLWKTLTAEQEKLRIEIINQRAERKARLEEKKLKIKEFKNILKNKKWQNKKFKKNNLNKNNIKISEIEEVKAIFQKYKSWEILTTKEKDRLNELRNNK